VAFPGEVPVHGASVYAEPQRNVLDGALACTEQLHDHVPNLERGCRRFDRCGPFLAVAVQHLLHSFSVVRGRSERGNFRTAAAVAITFSRHSVII
jgi:hypothetical protein